MASISDFGIGFALPTVALAALSLSVAAPAQPPATIDIQIEIAGLRDAQGQVRLCLTHDHERFPNCKGPGVVHGTIKASLAPLHYTFRAVPAGTYAVAAFHDANDNGKLDTVMGIPKEGYAFSRNPKVHVRAPHFIEASFDSNDRALAPLKMKYLF